MSAFNTKKGMDARELREVNSDVLKRAHITDEEVLEILKFTKINKITRGKVKMNSHCLSTG